MLGLYVNGVLAGKVMFTPLCVDWPEKIVVKLAPMLSANVVESEPTGFALYARLIVYVPWIVTMPPAKVGAAKKVNP